MNTDERLQEIKKTILAVRGVMAGLMLVTAVFTGGSVLALFAPETTLGYILAIIPALVMIALAEGMFIYQSQLFSDGDNTIQKVFSGTGLFLALLTIVLTDTAAAVFLAQASGYVSLYETVPEWAQVVVTYSMPIMAITHGVILAIYDAADDVKQAEKNARKELREAKVDVQKAYYASLADEYRKNIDQAGQRAKGNAEALFANVLAELDEKNKAEKHSGNSGRETNFTKRQ